MGAHGQGGEGKGTSSANGTIKGPFAGTRCLGPGPASSHPDPIARGDATSVPQGAPKSSARICALADVRHGSTPSFGSGRESKAVCRVASSFPSVWSATASSSSAGAGRDQPNAQGPPHTPQITPCPGSHRLSRVYGQQDITQRNKGGSLQKSRSNLASPALWDFAEQKGTLPGPQRLAQPRHAVNASLLDQGRNYFLQRSASSWCKGSCWGLASMEERSILGVCQGQETEAGVS